MPTNPMSTTEEIFAAIVGRALIEVLAEDICSQDDLRQAAMDLAAGNRNGQLSKNLVKLADAFDNTIAGPRTVMEAILK